MTTYDHWKTTEPDCFCDCDDVLECEETAECDELAASIWRLRNIAPDGYTMWSLDDALAIARTYLPDESETVLSNVAEGLWARNGKSR